MCSPSRSPLPPPSPSHPSGSSQCTSPEHPVSCIEPGLAICFTYDNIHVSVLSSQIIPPLPSPTESKSLKSDPDSHANWLVAEFGQCEVLAGNQKMDRKQKPGYFFLSQPWATTLALVIFPPWLLWRVKSLYNLREPLKHKEHKVRSGALEETQEGKDPSNISLISFMVNPPPPRFQLPLSRPSLDPLFLPAWKR